MVSHQDSRHERRRPPRSSRIPSQTPSWMTQGADESASRTTRRVSIIRAVALVALGAVLQAVISPYLTFGFLAPALALLCVVVATAGLKWSVALPVGFFGGTLLDALGAGLFGVGALSGVLAAAVSSRAGILGGNKFSRLRLAGVAAVAVAAHDLASVAALELSGESWPPMLRFLSLGVLPNAALNGVLAYAAGGLLLRFLLVKEKGWT